MTGSGLDQEERAGPRIDDGGFGSVVERPERLSDRVAHEMLDTILRRGLRPGDPLPSERELGEQYGVSRTVIREAIRALSARGVVVSRAGRGLAVAAVGPEQVSSSIGLYLHGRREMPYQEIHEVRSLLELQIVGLAAERGSDSEIAQLEALCERLREPGADVEVQTEVDIEFHRALARMTHNELYLILLDSLGPLMFEIRRAPLGAVSVVEDVYGSHVEIADRVRAHDVPGARAAMRRHLNAAVADWDRLGRPVDLTAGPRAGGR